MPISRDLICDHGKHAISTWVVIFKRDLEPWKGSEPWKEALYFVEGQNWEDGPVGPIRTPKCNVCRSHLYGWVDNKCIIEDSE
jgi:hypothetical protein